jgi:hypothetical protein
MLLKTGLEPVFVLGELFFRFCQISSGPCFLFWDQSSKSQKAIFPNSIFYVKSDLRFNNSFKVISIITRWRNLVTLNLNF